MNRSLISLVAIGVCSVFVTSALANDVRHLISPTDSVSTLQLQRACVTRSFEKDFHWCNPAGFFKVKKRPGTAHILIKADDETSENTYNILFKKVTKDELTDLFETYDFATFSGVARLETSNEYFALSYTPVHAIGAYRIANPSLPELYFAGLKSSEVRLTSGVSSEQSSYFKNETVEVLAGASVYRFDRTFVDISANSLTAVVSKNDELVLKRAKIGVNFDLGFEVLLKNPWVPSFGVSVLNLGSKQRTADNRMLSLDYIFDEETRLGTGWAFEHLSGQYYVGLVGRSSGLFSKPNPTMSAVAVGHKIGDLTSFASYSPLKYSFGFLFSLNHYSVGVNYTDEKQDSRLQIQRTKQVYVFVEGAI